MQVVLISTFLGGLLIGLGSLFVLPGVSDGFAKLLVKTGLKSNESWLIIQRANRYDLEPVEYSVEKKGYPVNPDDSEEELYEDDGGLMHPLISGVQVGLAYESSRAIVDSATAGVAQAEAAKTDGGEISPSEKLRIDEIENRALVGRLTGRESTGRIDIINPFTDVPDEETIVDVREVASLLTGNASPETPRRTARNAAEAERAFSGMEGLKQQASLIVAAMVGGILVYLGTSSGGGGGGGSAGEALPLILTALGVM